jgi:hypothetical protein
MGGFPFPLALHRMAMIAAKIVSCIGALHKGRSTIFAAQFSAKLSELPILWRDFRLMNATTAPAVANDPTTGRTSPSAI